MARLKTKQQRAIAALLSEKSITAAAEKANVPMRTLYNWLKRPEFIAELDQAERQLLEETTRRLAGLALEMVEVLASVARDENERTSHRLRAAAELLGQVGHFQDLTYVRGKLEELSNAIEWHAQESGQTNGNLGSLERRPPKAVNGH